MNCERTSTSAAVTQTSARRKRPLFHSIVPSRVASPPYDETSVHSRQRAAAHRTGSSCRFEDTWKGCQRPIYPTTPNYRQKFCTPYSRIFHGEWMLEGSLHTSVFHNGPARVRRCSLRINFREFLSRQLSAPNGNAELESVDHRFAMDRQVGCGNGRRPLDGSGRRVCRPLHGAFRAPPTTGATMMTRYPRGERRQ